MTRTVLFIIVALATLGLAEITNIIYVWFLHQPSDIFEPHDLTIEIVSHTLVVIATIGLLAWMSGWNIFPMLGAVVLIAMTTIMALAIVTFTGIIMIATDDPQGIEVIDTVINSYNGWQFQHIGIYLIAAVGATMTLWRNFVEDRLLVS